MRQTHHAPRSPRPLERVIHRPMSSYVHGGTTTREIARLEKQADFTASFTFSTLDLHPGQRVLDLATGVGAMGARLLRHCPGLHLVGVDLSAAQLAAARQH